MGGQGDYIYIYIFRCVYIERCMSLYIFIYIYIFLVSSRYDMIPSKDL